MAKSKFISKFLSLFSGTALGQLIIFISTPVLTRLYSPEDFGILTTVMSFIILVNVVGCLRYELAIPLEKSDRELPTLVLLNLIILLTITSILTLIIILMEFAPLGLLADVKLEKWLIPVGVLMIGLFQILTYILIRDEDYKLLGKTKVKQSTALVIIQLVFGILKPTPFTLLTGEITGRFYGIINVSKKRKNLFLRLKQAFKKEKILYMMKKYRKLPIYTAPASFINTLGVQGFPVLLLYFYGPVVAGFYSVSHKLLRSPIKLIGKSVSQVFFGQSSQYLETPKLIRKLFTKLGLILFLLGIAITGTLLVLEPFIFKHLLGDEWLDARGIFKILVFLIAFQLSIGPLSEVLTIVHKQELKLIWDVMRLITMGLTFVVCTTFGYSYLVLFKVYVGTMIALYLFLILLCFKGINDYVRRHDQV